MGGLLAAGLLPFVGALAVLLTTGPRSRTAGVVASAFVVASFAAVLSSAGTLLAGPQTLVIPWAARIGLDFTLHGDGLSLLFSLLITGVGSIVFPFATAYLGAEENRRRFFIYLLVFMGAMLGVVSAANLISLFVFWEMTSVSSFLLIGYWHQRDASRDGALKALITTGSGGLAMLVGFVLLGLAGGTYEISELIARRDLVAASPWAPVAAALVIVGAITKSAQLPFHLWLPSAMEAPTPVSAFLHAATMVKAGLYLVARLGPLLAVVELWTPTLTALGIATMAWGSFLALRQRDLKGLLAFSTVSQLGLILAMLAGANEGATSAGLFHLLNHGLFKGALFLLVGVIEHEAHTRDLTQLGPLKTQMPRTYGLLAVAALAMAGVPPLGGFVSKEMFLAEALAMPPYLAAVAVAGSVLTAGYCFALVFGLAGGRRPLEEAPPAHDPPLSLLWGPAVLVAGAIALGLAPQFLAGPLIESAAAAALGGHAPHLHLALWHGLNAALAASGAAIVGGALLYALWWSRRDPAPPVLIANRAYEAFLHGLETYARSITASYMSGLLWRYVAIILGTAAALVIATVAVGGLPAAAGWPSRPIRIFELLVCIVTIGAVVGAASARTRLAAILALGASGYALALLFALLDAPDLSLTQIMVETISVALFLTVFVYLPPYRPSSERSFRPLHAGLAALVGCGIPWLVYRTRGHRDFDSVGDFYLANSVDLAGGHNVVNVILVDFRGLDTMGEITVLGVAGLACLALIKTGRRGAVR